MTRATVLPLMRRAAQNHPMIASMATAAGGLMRQMTIKPYRPSVRRREIAAAEKVDNFPAVRNLVFKEKGVGEIPTIVIGGFVPDATEAVEFQRELLKSFGSIYYINYARNGFSAEMFSAQLGDLIEDINLGGKAPVIFAVSFGCGLVSTFLRERCDPGLRIKGVVMGSPVLCTDDLVRPQEVKGAGVRMLESNLRRILKADVSNGDDVSRQIERARRCFQSLFEAGAMNRELTGRHVTIRRKIMDALSSTTSAGGYERVLALKGLSSPHGGKPIFGGRTLVLLAESEDDLLAPTSPTLTLLRDPQARRELFPCGTFRTVISPVEGDAVPHASLIFHQHCYNPLIAAWYGRFVEPLLFAAV